MRIIRTATTADITRIAAAHGSAARLAVEAGFDAVKIHFGHNYFASSFLSPKLYRRRILTADRTKNRARVVLETARSVRDAVGDKIAILAKLNMDDGVPGGFWVDEAIQVATVAGGASGSVDAPRVDDG